MARRTRLFSTAIATAAMVGLPLLAAAQTQSYPQTQTGTATSTRSGQNSPEHHLDEARRVLDSISTTSLTGTAASGVSEIKTQFSSLEQAFRAGATSTGSTGTTTGTTGSTTPASDWMTYYSKIDDNLDDLGIPSTRASGSETGTMSGTTGGTGSTTAATSSTLDPTVKSKLTEFRRHLDLFHAAAISRGQASSSPYGSTYGTGGSSAGTASSTTGTAGTGSTSGTWQSEQSATSSSTATTQGAEYYLDQIERIVNQSLGTSGSSSAGTTGTTTGTTGTAGTTGSTSMTATVSISRSELEQIRQYVAQLRQVVKDKDR